MIEAEIIAEGGARSDPGIYISQRELIEWIELSKQNSESIKELLETLKGNGKPGLVRDVDQLKWKMSILTATLLLFVTPLAGLILSFVIGLLIHRVEVIVR
jgi:hypothetical protein